MDHGLVANTFAILLLLFFSLQDIRSRELSLKGLALSLLPGMVIACGRNGMLILSWVADLLPGITLLLIAGFSREAVGYGDGLVILILGLGLGAGRVITILLTALLLTVLWGGVQMVRDHRSRKKAVPFIPFLLIADVIYLIGEKVMR